MLDINFVREHSEIVKTSEKKRNRDGTAVDKVIELDAQWKQELKVVETLKHRRNVVSEEINQAKKQKKESAAQLKIKEMRDVVECIKTQEEKVAFLLDERNKNLKLIGNILDSSVPKGKDESENKEIKKSGKIPTFNFPIKDHIELGLELDLIDLETAAANSGARFYYLDR